LIINLINQKDIEIIQKEYKEYLDKNKIPLSNNNYESDEDENYEIYKNTDIISDSDNSDNSDDYMDDIKKNNHDNDSDDDDPNNNGNPKKYLISKTWLYILYVKWNLEMIEDRLIRRKIIFYNI